VSLDADALARLQRASFARAGGGLAGSWPPDLAMDESQLHAFLTERRYCVLATTTAEGHAIARPVAFTVLGAAFWFATVAGSRLRNLERSPWASVVIEDGDGDEHRAVAVDGPVTIADRPPADVLDAWEARHGGLADWAVKWFELRPCRLVSYAARKPG
jgi:nitroimidazol reductase NimA-like FMN-containing flavoprotein (pyridoxamine 5'-phosphate oxidase superfamily)